MVEDNNNDKMFRTDLLMEKNIPNLDSNIETFKSIKIISNSFNNYHYTTITFKDIIDKSNYLDVQKIFVRELKKYLDIKESDTILVIGLGNSKSTPDSLGPSTIDNVLVTRYLFLLGEVEDGYSNVCSFSPNVMGNTGIETADTIKSIIRDTKASKVIIIDALKTNNLSRLVKTIQITDQGISPGSGIGNSRKEISKKTMNIDIIAIGVPTVVDIRELVNTKIDDNYIVTPTNIDYIIEKLSTLIGNGINISLHKNFLRQNNN